MDTQTKVAFLTDAASYPERTTRVDVVETHMSWVFLTDLHAYKLKKPVRYPFLDFSTVQARRRDCIEELRLNRRLARDVYIAVIPLSLKRRGALRLGGAGAPVDWLVKMRRLPAEHMLERAMREDRVKPQNVRRFAGTLCNFYRGSPPVPLTAGAYRTRFERDLQAYRRALRSPANLLPAESVEAVIGAELGLVRSRPDMLTRRVREHRIVEAHGDLRPEHICLVPEPIFIDRPAFRREFRLLDPVDELAFLAIECEQAGAGWIGELLIQTYRERTSDSPPGRLLRFYKCYRACLRASLAMGHLTGPVRAEQEQWVHRAREYLRLALRYAPTP